MMLGEILFLCDFLFCVGLGGRDDVFWYGVTFCYFSGVCVSALTHHGRCFALFPGRLVGKLDCLFFERSSI
jgi:hypothetical protein